MTVQLILKPRKFMDKIPQWHDRVQVDNAITNILSKAGKPGKNFMWFSILGKIEEKAQELEYEKKIDVLDEEKKVIGQKLNFPPIPIELSNNQAKQLWRELENLIDTPSVFYSGLIKCPRCGNAVGTDRILDAGTLSIMLQDIASQLGEKWTEPDEIKEGE